MTVILRALQVFPAEWKELHFAGVNVSDGELLERARMDNKARLAAEVREVGRRRNDALCEYICILVVLLVVVVYY